MEAKQIQKTRSAEERETIVIQVEVQKDTPQLKTEAQDSVSSAAMRRICVLHQKSPRLFQIPYGDNYMYNTY